MDKLEIILGIGIGISCVVIGLQLSLHNADIRELKKEVKELRSEFDYIESKQNSEE